MIPLTTDDLRLPPAGAAGAAAATLGNVPEIYRVIRTYPLDNLLRSHKELLSFFGVYITGHLKVLFKQ